MDEGHAKNNPAGMPPPRSVSSPAPPRSDGGGFAMRLFALLFAGFVALHVFLPDAMARTLEGERGLWLSGLNVAMILGIGMILGAVALALLSLPRRS